MEILVGKILYTYTLFFGCSNLFQLVPTVMAVGIDFPDVGFAIDGALIVFIWRWRFPMV